MRENLHGYSCVVVTDCVMDIVWCKYNNYVVWKDFICNYYAIMCMHDIIVNDDGNVEHKDRQSRPGQDVPVTCVVLLPFHCVYC